MVELCHKLPIDTSHCAAFRSSRLHMPFKRTAADLLAKATSWQLPFKIVVAIETFAVKS